jgi:transcriptional regulator with XRE-family HTH domain
MRSREFTSALRAAGLRNQRELAEAIGCSRTKMSHLLTGERKASPGDLAAIAAAMHMTTDAVVKLVASEIAWRRYMVAPLR